MDIFGVSDVEEVSGFNLFDDPNLPIESRELLLKGETVKYETIFDFEKVKDLGLYRTSKSGIAHIYVIISPLYLEGSSRPSNYLVQVGDITERKRAEEDLRQSENKFYTVFNNMATGALIQRSDSTVPVVNAAAEKMLGIMAEQIHNVESVEANLQTIHEDGSPYPAEAHPSMVTLKTGIPIKNAVMGVYFPSEKDYRWININTVPQFRNDEDLPYEVFVTFDDITDRKRIEEALKNSEERYHRLFDVESDAIFLVDCETDEFIDANLAAVKMYGYSHEEFLMLKACDISAQPDKTLQAIATCEDYVPLRWHRRKDGSVFPVEIAGSYFYSHGRKIHVAAIRDITERRRSEEALKASLKEKEVLLREVYHRVKNNLQIIYSLLNIQNRSINDEKTKSILADCQNRIRSMALVHEGLYRSNDLARVNLAVYIRRLANHLLRSFNIDKRYIKLSLMLDDVFLEMDKAIPCGLIINELITNSLKHAFPVDRNGEIVIELHSLNGMIDLAIRDDGIGISGKNPDIGSVGLKLVSSLVGQLKGTIETHLSKGTEFRVRFPMS